MARSTYLLPVPTGTTPAAQIYKLHSQQLPIRTISCNNSSTVTVLIYQGPQTFTVPITVLPKKSITVAMAGPRSVWVAFNGVATADGFIYLSFTDREAELFATEGTGVT